MFSTRRSLPTLVALLLPAVAALLLLPAAAAGTPKQQAKEVEVQLLGLNDFHGHLEATTPGTIAADASRGSAS
jgi:2',3'-cyclic-nucleotide 2'-phosphodiesterase (5'-nucleotidase family)